MADAVGIVVQLPRPFSALPLSSTWRSFEANGTGAEQTVILDQAVPADQLFITVNGVHQQPEDYAVNSRYVTLTTELDDEIVIRYLGSTVPGEVTLPPSPDLTPDAFDFIDQLNVPLNSGRVSNTIIVSGLAVGASAPVLIFNGTYSKNGRPFQATLTTAQNGDTFAVGHVASDDEGAATSTTLIIGTEGAVFTSVTIAAGQSGGGGDSPWINLADYLASPRTPFVTDDLPAFTAAMAALPEGGRIIIPRGKYYCSDSIDVHKPIHFLGEGSGQNANVHPTLIRFGKNKHGFIFNHFNTQGDTTGTYTAAASASSLEGVALWGGNVNVDGSGATTSFRAGDSLTGHGVRVRTIFVKLVDVWAVCFGGDGFNIHCSAGGGGAIEGNANSFYLDSCQAQYCGGDGYSISGADANAGMTVMCSAVECAGSGFKDYSFLGNTHIQAHTRDCGIADPISNTNAVPVGSCQYQGSNYSVAQGQETAASTTTPGTNAAVWVPWTNYPNGTAKTWVPGLTWKFARPYANNLGNDGNGRGVWLNCYAESAQGPIVIASGWKFDGGVWTECGIDPSSEGIANDYVNGAMRAQSFRSLNQGSPASPRFAQLGERDNPLTWLMFQENPYPWRWIADGAGAMIFQVASRSLIRVTPDSGAYPSAVQLRTPVISTTDGDLAAGRTVSYGTAAPTAGEHYQGEIVFNKNAAAGGFAGWICTETGTPGTWKTFGPISA